MQDIGSLSYCLWGVFYSSESEKKKKKKKSVNAAFPPHFSTLQVWEENLRDEKGEISYTFQYSSLICPLQHNCSIHKGEILVENFKHWLLWKSLIILVLN